MTNRLDGFAYVNDLVRDGQRKGIREEQVCGACRWHKNDDQGWICANDASNHCADWTDYGDTCEEWEGRG